MATKTNKINRMKELDKTGREEVELIGTGNELKGEHTVHFVGGYVVFANGKAIVRKETAAILRKEGVIK